MSTCSCWHSKFKDKITSNRICADETYGCKASTIRGRSALGFVSQMTYTPEQDGRRVRHRSRQHTARSSGDQCRPERQGDRTQFCLVEKGKRHKGGLPTKVFCLLPSPHGQKMKCAWNCSRLGVAVGVDRQRWSSECGRAEITVSSVGGNRGIS